MDRSKNQYVLLVDSLGKPGNMSYIKEGLLSLIFGRPHTWRLFESRHEYSLSFLYSEPRVESKVVIRWESDLDIDYFVDLFITLRNTIFPESAKVSLYQLILPENNPGEKKGDDSDLSIKEIILHPWGRDPSEFIHTLYLKHQKMDPEFYEIYRLFNCNMYFVTLILNFDNFFNIKSIEEISVNEDESTFKPRVKYVIDGLGCKDFAHVIEVKQKSVVYNERIDKIEIYINLLLVSDNPEENEEMVTDKIYKNMGILRLDNVRDVFIMHFNKLELDKEEDDFEVAEYNSRELIINTKYH